MGAICAETVANVERQTSFRANKQKPQYRGRLGSGVPVNLSHAKVAREPAEPKPIPAPIAPPTIAKPPSPVGRLIATYHEFVDVCRDRADEMEISRSEIDRIAGLPDGHSAHLLARKFIKHFTPGSLPLVLDTLGLRLRVEEDPELTARTLRRRKRRESSHAHYPRELPGPPGDSNAA